MTTVTRQNHDIEPAPAEFTTFYRNTVERTFRLACRMAHGDRDVARDATLSAYERILRDWHSHENRARGDNARRAAGLAVRAVADSTLDELEEPPDEAPNAGHPPLEVVRHVFDRQPAERRAVAVLFFLEEYDYAEIADVLGIPESTIRADVERIRVLLTPLVDEGRT